MVPNRWRITPRTQDTHRAKPSVRRRRQVCDDGPVLRGLSPESGASQYSCRLRRTMAVDATVAAPNQTSAVVKIQQAISTGSSETDHSDSPRLWCAYPAVSGLMRAAVTSPKTVLFTRTLTARSPRLCRTSAPRQVSMAGMGQRG